MYVYSMIKTLFLDIVVTANTAKIKEKVVENNKQGESTPPKPKSKHDGSTTTRYLRISNDIKCANMTASYVTLYAIFVSFIYFIASFDTSKLKNTVNTPPKEGMNNRRTYKGDTDILDRMKNPPLK
jgi:hypothetical protein